MGVCYLIANHSRKEYLARGEKFIEMDSEYSRRIYLYLFTQYWNIRKPTLLQWVGDNEDLYDGIKKTYENIEDDFMRYFTEWIESDMGKGHGVMIDPDVQALHNSKGGETDMTEDSKKTEAKEEKIPESMIDAGLTDLEEGLQLEDIRRNDPGLDCQIVYRVVMLIMFAKLKRRCSGKLMAFVPLVSASILGDLGSILDRIFGICLVILIIVLILIGAWILSYFFGSGGGRG